MIPVQEIFTQDVLVNLASFFFVILVIFKVEKLMFPSRVTDDEIEDYVEFLRENGRMWNLPYSTLLKGVLQKRKKVKCFVMIMDVVLLMVLSILFELAIDLSFSNFVVISICIAVLIAYAVLKITQSK